MISIGARSAEPSENMTVITAGPETVTLGELIRQRNKEKKPNNDEKAIDSLIERMVNYKLTIAAAREEGLDTTAAFLNEMGRYRHELALPYLRDTHIDDSLVSVAYRHLQEVLDIEHIFIPSPENPAERGETAARAEALRKNLRDSLSFGEQIELTGGMWPYFFEDLAFTTPVGEISPVKESAYGFHVLRVKNRRENPGMIKVRHILKQTRDLTPEEAAIKKHQIDSIHGLVAAGGDFTSIAAANTEDPKGKENGGELPWFGPGEMAKEFEKAAFGLKPGEISAPIKTDFGWHIIISEGIRPLQPLDSLRPVLEKAIRSDERSSAAIEATVNRWKRAHPDKKDMSLAEAVNELIAELPEKNAEYKRQITEFEEGLLVYEISDREIWSRAASDSAGLEECFRNNRSKFRWERPHYKGYVVYANSDSIADAAAEWLKSTLATGTDQIKSTDVRKRFGKDVKIDMIIAGRGDNKIVDYLCFNGAAPEDSHWQTYRAVNGRVITSPENATDTKGAVVSKYQKILEEEWMKKLRKRYKVKVNRKAIKKALGF